MVDRDLELMQTAAENLEECSRQIVLLCEQLEQNSQAAHQCMDEKAGLEALKRLLVSVEEIKRVAPISDDQARKLVLSRKLLLDAQNTFSR